MPTAPVKIPVAKIASLAVRAARASKGGFTASETRDLGLDALGIARIVLTPLLPATIAPVVGVVLDTVGSLIADPPSDVAEAAERVLEAVSALLPAEVEAGLGG